MVWGGRPRVLVQLEAELCRTVKKRRGERNNVTEEERTANRIRKYETETTRRRGKHALLTKGEFNKHCYDTR
jgi:hypothetical protein